MIMRIQHRAWMVAALGAACCRAAVAQSPPAPAASLPPALEVCTKIAADEQRLQCFDRESAALAHSTATPALPPDAAPVVLTPAQKMGLSQDKISRLEANHAGKPAAPELKSIQARLTQVTATGAGRYVFTLDNGQVWHQIETRSSFTVMPGALVTLSRGMIGSFWLSTGPHNSTRVERVQ